MRYTKDIKVFKTLLKQKHTQQPHLSYPKSGPSVDHSWGSDNVFIYFRQNMARPSDYTW